MWHRANVANGRNGILGAKNVLASRTIGEQWNLCVVFFFPRIDPAGRLICTVRPDVSSEKQTSPERKKERMVDGSDAHSANYRPNQNGYSYFLAGNCTKMAGLIKSLNE